MFSGQLPVAHVDTHQDASMPGMMLRAIFGAEDPDGIYTVKRVVTLGCYAGERAEVEVGGKVRACCKKYGSSCWNVQYTIIMLWPCLNY